VKTAKVFTGRQMDERKLPSPGAIAAGPGKRFMTADGPHPSFNLIVKMISDQQVSIKPIDAHFFMPKQTKRTKQTKPRIKISVNRASELFHVDRMLLARRLKVAYPEGRPGNKFTLSEVHRALCTPEQQARARSATARADLLEFKYQEAAARLIPVEEFRDGVEDFTKVASEVISSLEAPEDLKRTLLRNIAGIKKTNLAAVDQLLKDRAAREGRAS
jgi:hypothetical protein